MIDKKALRKYFLDCVYGRAELSESDAEKYGFSKQAWDDVVKHKIILRSGDDKTKCRYCGEKVSEDNHAITYTYYSGMMDNSHKNCEVTGKKQESYECQKIDADCNDCFFYKREISNGQNSKGICEKFNKPVSAHMNFASGNPCFVHRLDNLPEDLVR